MFKIYKKVILVQSPNQGHRLDSSVQAIKPDGYWFANLLAVPAMIVGAVLITLFFSVFFALFMIPVSIIGLRAWWLLRKLKQSQLDQTLDAEYTVIKDTVEKPGSGK